MIGRALNGRYELGEILGVGGMATVYRGHDHQLGRPVAVKVLNGGLADDPRFADRFGQEAQHAARLHHPRIVTVFDSGVDQGSPYIVMELVHGRPLSQLIAETTWLPVERAVGIAAAVCEALEVAHAAGLVHRDIKPGNIMITHDGGVKVVDFGIARASSSGAQLTQTAAVLGTAGYLSPEQATASPLDGRSDLYAVGCVLTEMLTGEAPFTGDTSVAIAFRHVTEQPAPPSYRRPGLPPALDDAVLRLLAKNPADRPADAAAARAELLSAVPVFTPADRTGELLAETRAMPPVTAPYQDPQRTSFLSPTSYPADPEPGPGLSRRAFAYAGVGLVAVAGAAVIGLLTLGGPDPSGARAASTPSPSASESASPSPSVTPSAKASPSVKPSATPKPGPAAAVVALRAAVAQADLGKERDRYRALLDELDQAAQAFVAQEPEDAESALRNAQRLVRDLAKKHAIDNATSQAWQTKIGALISTID
ncbi:MULTISPECIES: protein kinase [unclassified Kitasatospora]|uniref:protein kinase domain-containing protein n=1 Tax=unclassified Kitasatospora TaxID=2633591 RepID=UPI000AC2FF4C|nr:MULTISPECIES: protein kinase [unclassified Kitasatospora]